MNIKKVFLGAPGWLSQLGVWVLVSALGMISGSWDEASHWAPCSAGNLLELLLLPLFLPLLVHSHGLSLKISVFLKLIISMWRPKLKFSAICTHGEKRSTSYKSNTYTTCMLKTIWYWWKRSKISMNRGTHVLIDKTWHSKAVDSPHIDVHRFLKKKDFICLFMRDRERGRDPGRRKSRLHAGSPVWDSIPEPRVRP